VATPPRLRPNIGCIYRELVARLREALAAEGGTEMLEEVRALVHCVEVQPSAEAVGEPRVDLIGELTAMLRAAGVSVPASGAKAGLGRAKGPRRGAVGPDLVVGSVKVDAGTRKHLDLMLTS
jgi:hypothetical protein